MEVLERKAERKSRVVYNPNLIYLINSSPVLKYQDETVDQTVGIQLDGIPSRTSTVTEPTATFEAPLDRSAPAHVYPLTNCGDVRIHYNANLPLHQASVASEHEPDNTVALRGGRGMLGLLYPPPAVLRPPLSVRSMLPALPLLSPQRSDSLRPTIGHHYQ
jgi:hypothetical protein